MAQASGIKVRVLHKYLQTMSKASLGNIVLAILRPNTHRIISSQPHLPTYLPDFRGRIFSSDNPAHDANTRGIDVLVEADGGEPFGNSATGKPPPASPSFY